MSAKNSEVNILPFVRMKHPGTITWLWGRIIVGAKLIVHIGYSRYENLKFEVHFWGLI